MNVSGVNPSAGIYTYNSIRLNELRNQQMEASKEARNQMQLQEPENWTAFEQNYTSFDYAQQYRAGEVYDLKGADADIAKLDVAKAVSDLDKDQILQQYQYFVGDTSYATAKANTAETKLRSGENFSL